MIYETVDTPANRQIQQEAGYQDGLNLRPAGTNDRFGKESPALKGIYDHAYLDGLNQHRLNNPAPVPPRQPMLPDDYTVEFRRDFENMPIDVPCLAVWDRNDFVAVVVREDEDLYSYVLGFDDCAYGLGGPLSELTGWYPLRKRDVPASAMPSDVQSDRSAAADDAYEAFDFGYQVEDAEGWEYSTPGDEMTRNIYLLPCGDENASDEAGSFRVTCTVRFVPGTAEIAEIYATDEAGNNIGQARVTA